MLRPAGGQLRPARADPGIHRGGPAEHLAVREPAAGAARRGLAAEHRAGLDPAGPRRPAGRARSACARCGSRTSAATRPTRSRTGWSPSRWPPRIELGFKVLACPSTGNLANAVAAAAARAGIRSVVFIPADLEPQKILATAVYGGTRGHGRGQLRRREPARLRAGRRARGLGVRQRQRAAVLRRGLEDHRLRDRRAARLAAAGADRGAGRVRRPARQDRQGVPRAGRARPGRRRRAGRCSAPRPAGCSPVAAAFRAGHDVVQPVRPDTIAKSLAIGNPADGPYVLDVVRRTGGARRRRGRRRDRGRDPAARRDRGHLRRDRGRGHHRHRCAGCSPPGSSTPRPRPSSSTPATGSRPSTRWPARSACPAPIRPDAGSVRRVRSVALNPRKAVVGMSVSVRIPTILRTYTGGAAEVTAEAGTLREVIAGLDAAYPGLGGRILDDGGQAAAVRQRVRRRRGRPARAGARHPGPAGGAGLGHPRGRRWLRDAWGCRVAVRRHCVIVPGGSDSGSNWAQGRHDTM